MIEPSRYGARADLSKINSKTPIGAIQLASIVNQKPGLTSLS